MKKVVLIVLAFLLFRQLPAPEAKRLFIASASEINTYDPLIKAIICIETDHGRDFYNEKENAVGHFQIRQIRVDDYNQRTKSHYKLSDFYDYKLARKMFLYYAKGKSFEKAAKNWNGSGPMTEIYWKKVKYHI
jgi:hypothetical protein